MIMLHVHMWVPNDKEQRKECDYVDCGAASDYLSKENRTPGIYDRFSDDPGESQKCNHKCEPTEQNLKPLALHYLDCPIWEFNHAK
jgi:hypothetical protein